MKLFKNLVMYCIVIILIMSLTSSFEFSRANTKNITKLSIKSEKMQNVFFNSYNTKENTQEDGSEVTGDTNLVDQSIDTSVIHTIGDSGEDVFRYQKILYYMDYIKNIPDGNFGDEMYSAVESFQESKDLEVTGKLDSQTQLLLLNEKIEYIQGKSGDEILEYQLILYYLDYMQNYPEGQYGSGTVTSVKKYQKDKSLEETGLLNTQTQEALKQEQITYKLGKRGDEIKEYQKALITLDYLSGSADGQYGNNTLNAVKQFQKDNNLEETGTIDKPTQEILNKSIE
ncbi:hypothetical protein GC105_07750 [Alkalibaculum sp. M08DMB]|uniref:Peptidoglycan binding-like domain-containing protein n=1 Tax=Alkalibaculum sporogenes TaxID=2655001 RepID=A0A6A7K8G9_9FIRM|nr:peptidoglycan-binding protein [Alkalibaculum sporogenes]MPW25682.1 hypothetical protein [Alkalibaculum sporogenes]